MSLNRAALSYPLPCAKGSRMESLHTLGWVLYRVGKANESEVSLRECLQKRRMILGDQHPKVGALFTA